MKELFLSQQQNGLLHVIDEKIELLIESFKEVLYRSDEQFMENLGKISSAPEDANRYKYWEWTQGVGLYGIWELYEATGRKELLKLLVEYFDARISEGLPGKNVNTTAPLLALVFVYKETGDLRYKKVCTEWADWILHHFPRTKSGGFQHITSDSTNEEELWDDTLFMTVLFLAKLGKELSCQEYIEEAKYQFLTHIKYLADPASGLWYHGWTFQGNHNFTKAFWGRGNCWVTLAIPIMLSILNEGQTFFSEYLKETLQRQAEALAAFQEPQGMWHTIIDDPSSYVESSATAGFGAGILKAIEKQLIPPSFEGAAEKALLAIIELIDEQGILHQSSYGTPMGRDSKSFYNSIPLQPMPYSQALGMLFLIEARKLCS